MTEDKVKRWNMFERWQHIHLVIAGGFLLVTGAALLYNKTPYLEWLSVVLGGLDVTRMFHKIFGAVIVATVIAHLVGVIFIRKMRSKVWPSWRDIRYFTTTTLYHLGISNTPPPKDVLGFHDPILKFDYWFAGVLALGCFSITGIILSFKEQFSVIIVKTALLLHDIGFVLALAYIIFHVFFVTAIRENRPTVEAMFMDGMIPLKYVKKRHPQWYMELKEKG